jgi:hypothetical protein
MRRPRLWLVAGALLLVVIAAWVAYSIAYTVPNIRVGMTQQEVEAILGQPTMRTQDEGRSGVGVYRAAPGWLLSRHDLYIVTYDTSGQVASYDLIEDDFGPPRWTHH